MSVHGSSAPTLEAAAKAGIAFEPEKSAYAGKENPVGKKFQGLVRWAKFPVVKDGHITGYVTLALDHSHIAEFTDHVTPGEDRYADITDPASGNDVIAAIRARGHAPGDDNEADALSPSALGCRDAGGVT